MFLLELNLFLLSGARYVLVSVKFVFYYQEQDMFLLALNLFLLLGARYVWLRGD